MLPPTTLPTSPPPHTPTPRPAAWSDDRPASTRGREPQLPGAVVRPDARDEPVSGSVGEPYRIGFIDKRRRDKDGPEHFLAGDAASRRNVAEQPRRDVKPARGGVGDDGPLRDRHDALALA